MLDDLDIQFPKDFEELYVKYKAFLEGVKIEAPKETAEKYSGVKEDIALKSLGIEILGNYVSKGKNGFKINPTDRQLIDFLHYRFSEENGWCSDLDSLEKELGKAQGTIKNRISYINEEVKKLINPSGGKTNIDEFIKNETGRGYHLNARFVIEFTKKKQK